MSLPDYSQSILKIRRETIGQRAVFIPVLIQTQFKRGRIEEKQHQYISADPGTELVPDSIITVKKSIY